jgi:hypothetical protein
MRRKAVFKPYSDTPVPPEEYLMFAGQGEAVLRSYRLARISMAAGLPLFALLSVFHAGIAVALAVTGGLAALFILRKKYSLKEAAAPLICALCGAVTGVFLIAPLVKPTEIIQEAYRGF